MKQRQQGIFILSESVIFSHRITVMICYIKEQSTLTLSFTWYIMPVITILAAGPFCKLTHTACDERTLPNDDDDDDGDYYCITLLLEKTNKDLLLDVSGSS